MPVISQEQAVEQMTRQVKQFKADELLEVYNELFPQEKRTEAEVNGNLSPLVQRLVGYINGQPVDMLMFLWSFLFPARHLNVSYDEETDGICYEESNRVSAE